MAAVAMQCGWAENIASCNATASGQGYRGKSTQRSDSARPPLPSGGLRPALTALADITNRTAEQQPPRQADTPIWCCEGQTEHSGALPAKETPVFPQVVFADSVDEYIADISEHLFCNEGKSLLSPGYMESQPGISKTMRTVLVDWLVDVHTKQRLRLETLHLSVNIVDRYLSKRPATRKSLQLVGVAAMLIASKFEEIEPPNLDFWVYITAKAFTEDDVINMECAMLAALGFQIMVPTAAHFLPLLQKANGCDHRHSALVEYLVELCLLDIRMLCYAPSHVVSAALLLSNKLLGRKQPWPPAMMQLSRHPAKSLQSCVQVMRELFQLDRACIQGRPRALHKKFSDEKRYAVATMLFWFDVAGTDSNEL